jgi:hypothetical protein
MFIFQRCVFGLSLIQKITMKVHMCLKFSGYEAIGILRIKVPDGIIGEIYILLILFIKCNLKYRYKP